MLPALMATHSLQWRPQMWLSLETISWALIILSVTMLQQVLQLQSGCLLSSACRNKQLCSRHCIMGHNYNVLMLHDVGCMHWMLVSWICNGHTSC